ncbi:MAG: tandem-95 repeat protein, partial [Planctomycetales bacterium]|nr:tandem-95 repeat protein [Planctomycetales bacterium]
VNSGNFYGIRFEVVEPLHVDRVGGNFLFFSGTGPFAAIVELDDVNDLPDSVDLSTPDVVATTIVPLAFQDDGDKRGDMDVTLEPGWYALMFGTEKFGSTGITSLPVNNTPLLQPSDYLHARLGVPEFFPISQANSTWKARFVLEGSTASDGPITLASGARLTMEADGSFTYDPNGQFESLSVGSTVSDSFTYDVTDSIGLTTTASVTITVAGGNDAPTAVDDSYVVSEQSLLSPGPSVGVIVNDSDVDGTQLTVTQINGVSFVGTITLPSGATVTPAAEANRFIYDPTTAFNYLTTGQSAIDQFEYQITDEWGATATATITITVNGFDDAPIAVDDNYVVSEESFLSPVSSVGLLANDYDPEDTPLTITHVNDMPFANQITLPTGATIEPHVEPNRFIYNPRVAFDWLVSGQTGSDSFTYTAIDAQGQPASATVRVTINGVDDPAVISGDTEFSVGEDTDIVSDSLSIVDPDLGQARFVAQTGVTSSFGTFEIDEHGTWAFDLDNQVSNLLNEGESPIVSFLVSSLDGSATVTVHITIVGGADADTDGVDDTIEELIGDGNGDGIPDSAQDDVASLFNAVTGTYVTLAAADGAQLFDVIASDPQLLNEQPPGDVQLPIGLLHFNAIVDAGAPLAVRLYYDAAEPVNAVYKYGLLAGGDPDYYEFEDVEFGIDAAGNHYVELYLVDGGAGDADGMVNGVIDDPVGLALVPGIGDDLIATYEDQAISFNPFVNDVLVQPVTIVEISSPQSGCVELDEVGNLSYHPNDSFFGSDPFTYTVIDGNGVTWSATVSVTVLPVNDVPTISVEQPQVMVDEGELATNFGMFGDVDVDDELSLFASVGSVESDGAGGWAWSWNPQDGPSESHTVTITVDDGQTQASASFWLDVNNVAPTLSLTSSHPDLLQRSLDGEVTLTGVIVDPGSRDTHQVTIAWGDGTSSQLTEADITNRSFATTHEYQSGGVHDVIVYVTDGQSDPVEYRTSAVVTGAGLVDGTLYLIGTEGRDFIEVRELQGKNSEGDTRVHWTLSQTPSQVEVFAAGLISRMEFYTFGGNDQITIRDHAGIGTHIDAGDGDNRIRTEATLDVIVTGAGDDVIET